MCNIGEKILGNFDDLSMKVYFSTTILIVKLTASKINTLKLLQKISMLYLMSVMMKILVYLPKMSRSSAE